MKVSEDPLRRATGIRSLRGPGPPARPEAVAAGRGLSIGALVATLVGVQAVCIAVLVTVAALVRLDARAAFVLAAAATASVLLAGQAIYRRIVRPIRDLATAVDQVTHGHLSIDALDGAPPELARMAERFTATLQMRSEAEGILVSAYDTERRAADRLRELDEMKDSFLLAISHELRTPLTSVSGYAALLRDEAEILSTDEIVEFADAVAISAHRLERLLLDLLDIERLTRGVIVPRRRHTDMRELVRKVLEHTGSDGGVEVVVAPGTVASVDPSLVERMVENLVVNAAKHTPPGTRARVSVGCEGDEVVLAVDDSGPGIPDDLKTVVFEPFRSADGPEHSPGTGIGLTLVAEFAKLHGGRAWVEDRPGGGSSFRVVLPGAAVTTESKAS